MLIDTHQAVEDLQRAGASKELAETITRTFGSVSDQVAEKQDLKALRTDLQEDMDALRTDLQEDMKALRRDLHEDMDALRENVQEDIDALRKDLHRDMDALGKELRQEMKTQRSDISAEFEKKLRVWGLTIVFGQVALTTLVFAAFRFFA